ncbi:unnamed protein product, partial [Aureobasidium pullulans]
TSNHMSLFSVARQTIRKPFFKPAFVCVFVSCIWFYLRLTPPQPAISRAMHIQSIPMWEGSGNNYAYLVVDDNSKDAVIIDPANPSDGAINLKNIINTHHHHDHAGGNVEMTPAHGETFNVGSIKVKALHTPCHTQDSICYLFEDGEDKAVFTGDTLFIGALNKTLAALPDETKVYYTKGNVKFGIQVLQSEPVKKLEAFANANKQTQGKFTIGDEKKATGKTSPVDVMAALREMKNNS